MFIEKVRGNSPSHIVWETLPIAIEFTIAGYYSPLSILIY